MHAVLAEYLQHEIREAVDDIRQRREAGRRIDHAENAPPSDPIQIHARRLEARHHAEGDAAGAVVGIFGTHLGAHLAERPRDVAIGVGRQVPGDGDPIADHAHQLEAALGEAHRFRQFEAEFLETRLYAHRRRDLQLNTRK